MIKLETVQFCGFPVLLEMRLSAAHYGGSDIRCGREMREDQLGQGAAQRWRPWRAVGVANTGSNRSSVTGILDRLDASSV